MSAPHEREWKKDEHRAGVIHATDAITLEIRVAFWRIPGGGGVGLEQALNIEALALAVPDMAQALLMQGGVRVDGGPWHTTSCWNAGAMPCLPSCEAARAALRKAGVIS